MEVRIIASRINLVIVFSLLKPGDSATAIVMLLDRDAAEAARGELHGSLQFGRLLSVEWARHSDKSELSLQDIGNLAKPIVSIFVQFNCMQASDAKVAFCA